VKRNSSQSRTEPRFIGIKIKFMVFAVCLTLAGIGALALVASKSTSQALTDEAEHALQLFALQGERLISHKLEAVKREVDGVAARNVIRSQDPAKQMPALEAEVKRLGYQQMGIVSQDWQAHYPDGSTADLKGREYLEKAFAGETNVSTVLISKVTGKPVLMAAAPIKSEDGSAAQVLIARLDAITLTQVTDSIKYGETGYSFIVDQEGKIMAHDDRKLVEANESLIKPEEDTKANTLSRAFVELLGKEAGTVQYMFRGDQRIVGYKQIPGTKWHIVAGLKAKELRQNVNRLILQISLIAGLLVVTSIVVSAFLAAKLVKPIKTAAAAMHQVAQGEGDLTSRLDTQGDDEAVLVAHGFNEFVGRVEAIVIQVSQAAEASQVSAACLMDEAGAAALANSATQGSISEIVVQAGLTEKAVSDIADGVGGLSQAVNEVALGSQDQAKRLERSTLEVESATRSIASVSQGAAEAKASVLSANEAAKTGSQKVKEVIQGMAAIQTSTGSAQQHITELGEAAEKIDSIVQGIQRIAGQTNLLALNAAIEAARAGEHGRGFAVVAEEVRKLAEDAENQTKSIDAIIREIQALTEQAVGAMASTSKAVEAGSNLSEEAGRSLAEIQTSISSTVRVIETVADNAKQTEQAATAVLDEITGLAAVTQQATAASEEMAASCHELADQARRTDSIGKLALSAALDGQKSAEASDARVKAMREVAEGLAEANQELSSLVGRFKTSRSSSNTAEGESLRKAA